VAQRLRFIHLQQRELLQPMNAKVEKKINGVSVVANPIYKGGLLPAYWACSINDRMIQKTFSSATEVFRFAENMKQH
jgi:hypothetical protein